MPGVIAELVVDCVSREFESGAFMKHCGVWDETKAYPKGACAIYGGGTWLAVVDVPENARPGKALEWRLIAKGDKQ
jgi:hypothetical protein